MVRQYVGARYVPKLASPAEWAANTSYEALTIVTFNNASYTSKVPVPPTVGNPANNPQYWALTGNYNAQVEQYRQETETVSNNLTTEITNRENADTTLQDQITREITNRENADTTLQGQITTEITNRENADTTLQDQITQEITNRKTADATFQDNIEAEATARQTANDILQGKINSEVATRASADSNLQSQINQIVAPSGEAPSAAEVQNARIGADGVTYDTLGNAIRSQVGTLKEELKHIGSVVSPDLISGSYLITRTNDVGGKIAVGVSQNAKYSRSIYMTAGSKLYVRGCAKDNVTISLVAASLSDDITTATCKVIVNGSSYKTIVYTAPRNEYVWTSSRNELVVFQYSDTIENLKNEISKDKVPFFYKGHLETKIKEIQDTAKSIVTGDSFVFITDVHVGANNMISPLLIDEILSRTSIRNVFFGGDVPAAYGEEESLNEQTEKFRKSFSRVEMFFGAKGNHDFTIENSSSDSSGVTESISWNRDITLRKIEAKITAYNNEPLNYYMDSALSKIRYIVLNVYELSQSEEKKNESYQFYPGMYDGAYKWLEEALKVDVGWDVIIFAHSACDESISGYSKNLSPLNQLLDAYIRKEKRTISSDYNNFSVDFSSASGKIIAYICGHNHKDESHVQNNGLLTISTTCDAHYSDDGIQRTVGTTDECAFDVFFVDKKIKKIKSIRIGAGSDREFSY